MRRKNLRIIQSQISDNIRISTAGIWYSGEFFNPLGRYQIETWCFSDDLEQSSFQVIHGSSRELNFKLTQKAIKIHCYITSNLRKKFNPSYT